MCFGKKIPKNCNTCLTVNVKHCLDFSFVFSAPLPAWISVFSKWDLLRWRYQPGCTGIFRPAEGTRKTLLYLGKGPEYRPFCDFQLAPLAYEPSARALLFKRQLRLFDFIFWISPNLTKYIHGWSPLELRHHKIARKKTLAVDDEEERWTRKKQRKNGDDEGRRERGRARGRKNKEWQPRGRQNIHSGRWTRCGNSRDLEPARVGNKMRLPVCKCFDIFCRFFFSLISLSSSLHNTSRARGSADFLFSSLRLGSLSASGIIWKSALYSRDFCGHTVEDFYSC